jgi:hypothetical protein
LFFLFWWRGFSNQIALIGRKDFVWLKKVFFVQFVQLISIYGWHAWRKCFG